MVVLLHIVSALRCLQDVSGLSVHLSLAASQLGKSSYWLFRSAKSPQATDT